MTEQLHMNKPLAPSQRILDTSTGEVWKIVLRNHFYQGEGNSRTRMTPKGERQCLYVYGCVAVDYDDERIVFDDQIGREFQVLG